MFFNFNTVCVYSRLRIALVWGFVCDNDNSKRKRVCVSLQQKLDVLQILDRSESVIKLASEIVLQIKEYYRTL